MSIVAITIIFFFVANPIGNAPAVISMVKDFDFQRQRWIVLRETMLALMIAFFFQYFGGAFLSLLHLRPYTITTCGGILLIIVAVDMIFSKGPQDDVKALKSEPFLIPIATPLLAGPGLMTVIMQKTEEINDSFIISSAILITWIGVMAIMMLAPYLQKILRKRGLMALEQIMGLILLMISMDMIVKGIDLFLKSIPSK